MKKKSYIIAVLALMIMPYWLVGQDCNKWPLTRCIGNGLDFISNKGQSAHFMNLKNNATLNSLTNAMTVEMWIKPDLELGKRNYFAGKWGPTVDKSDVWQLYYDPSNRIVFELNHPTSELEDVDNTIAISPQVNINGGWHHLAAVFDGTQNKAMIYLDGELIAEGTNPSYPIATLKKNSNDTQFGRANELTNNNSYRTFRGIMDEIKIWNRALPMTEIICEKDKRRNGNEAGLIAYFRCNEDPGNYSPCDVTQNNNANLLSGLTFTQTKNDRPEYRPFIVTDPVQIDTIKCTTRKRYSITITDTSLCGSRAYIWITPEFRNYFDYSGSYLTLPPNTPVTYEFFVDSDFIGTIKPQIRIIRDDVCGYDLLAGNKRQWTITRETELKYNRDTIGFGTLKAFCIEEPYKEISVKVTNNTSSFGTPKPVTITGGNFNLPQYYSIVTPSFPITLNPGESTNLIVRFTSGSVANIFYDTLRVQSTDMCEGAGIIPLTGEVENIISLTKFGTEDEQLDSIDFGTICKNFPSDETLFYWENLSSQNIIITDVEVPENFEFVRFNKSQPQTLEPQKSYQVKLIRFLPKVAGDFIDTVFIVVKAGGCTLRKPIQVKGKSIHPDITFTLDTIDYGNVFVGQELERNIKIRNNGLDEFRVSFSISRGEAFYFPGGRFATIPPKEERDVRVRFRPITDSLYYDKLCFQETPETGCYASGCITLKGRGIIDKFRFNPEVMKIENVIACKDSTNELFIINESPVSLLLNNFNLNDPSTKYDIIEPVNDLSSLNSYSINLTSGDSVKFKFRYTPNDLNNDRADKAFLEFSDHDNQQWFAFLQASSTLPKLFMEDNNAFGTVEVGETPTKKIILENISSIPVHLDSLRIGSNFTILYPPTNINRTLEPRDTIQIIVEFAPTSDINYSTRLISYSSEPCAVENDVLFTGKGKIIPIEIISTLVTFGFVKSCDCETTNVTLSNNSRVNDAIIDNIWIDNLGIVGPAYPEYFSWTSDIANNGNELPYSIPPLSKDTLRITYCPSSPSIRDSLNHSAMMHIDAHGISKDGQTEIWRLEKPYNRFLAGRQTLMYEPEPLQVQFPPTLVATTSPVPQFVRITIPDIDYNPDRETLKIDSITFEPNDNVFFAHDTLSKTDKGIIYSANQDTLIIQLDFKPRISKDYFGKMKIHFAEPCQGFDTTVAVAGTGLAFPAPMPFKFTPNDQIQEYEVISCDTLLLPVYAFQLMNFDIIDIDCQIFYDTTFFDYIGFESAYLGNTYPDTSICNIYNATLDINKTDSSSIFISLDNFCSIDSLTPLFIAKFTPKLNQTTTRSFLLDSFSFDSKGIIPYRLIPNGPKIDVTILKSEVTVLNDVTYDTVYVLDCKQDTFMIQNTGSVPFILSQIINLPPDVNIVSVTPALSDTLFPAAIAEVILEFCPTQIGEYSSIANSEIFDPCFMTDSNSITGVGFAPPYEVLADVSSNFSIIDTVYGSIGDTVLIPIFIDKDIMANYKGIEHWMIDIYFDLNISYDPFSMKYLESYSIIPNVPAISDLVNHGNLKMKYKDVDTLRASQIAELKMLVTIPIDTTTLLDITIDNFGSEYIYFLDLYNSIQNNLFNSGKSCRISHIVRKDNSGVEQNHPNPWFDKSVIPFKLSEKTNPILKVYDATGKLVKYLLNGNKSFEKGEYEVIIYSNDLLQGIYYYVLETETQKFTKQMVIIK
ncbi:MAG: LamG-like jellyroll fold domain-containing protein [Candidatus Kapaibacterium sp.]|nr:T9SS type A sorting domain-containing protein [Ignavibacteriota bacterium]MCB9220751.1 T9SS type A sorting domain-containing protein [Ignavibacteria bacterium]